MPLLSQKDVLNLKLNTVTVEQLKISKTVFGRQ